MSGWKDVCRSKNGSDVCDTPDACDGCVREAARQMTDRLLKRAVDKRGAMITITQYDKTKGLRT